MNPNNEYSNYAYRHLELLGTVMRQLETINRNMSTIYANTNNINNTVPITNRARQPRQTRQTRPYASARPDVGLNNTNTNRTTTTLDNNNINNLATNILNSLFWDPVAVYPTPEEIENATTGISFSDLPENNSRCPITLEPFTESSDILRIDACGHCFTRSGITRWFRNHVNCPVCRHDIRGNTNQDNSNDAQTENNTQTLQFDFTLNPNLTSSGSIMTFPLPPNYRNNGTGRGAGGAGSTDI